MFGEGGGDYDDRISTYQDVNVKDKTQQVSDSPEGDNVFDETKKKVYQNLNLGYSQNETSNVTKKIVGSFDNNSLEGILFNNAQIQSLLNSALNDRQKDWTEINKIHQQKKNEEKVDNPEENEEEEDLDDDTDEDDDYEDDYDEEIESWEDYSLHESSPEKFEQFLLSEEGINILKKEIDDHTDSDGNIYQNYPISKKVLLLKLKKAWFSSIREEYNKKYQEIDDDKTNIKKYGELVAQGIDDLVGEFLKGGGDKNGNGILKQLESLFNDKNGRFVLDMKENSIGMDNFIVSLKESINRYANIILKKNNGDRISLSTGETQLDLQFKLYLFIYGKLSYPNDFTGKGELVNYEENLVELLEAILHHDGQLETVKYNKYMEKERKLKEERERRDAQRRKEIAKRNRERNNRDLRYARKRKETSINGIRSSNSSNATGAEIAANANLGKDLKDYNLNIDESEYKTQRMKEIAFRRAWKTFIQSHDNIKDIITKWDMRMLFDINNGRIDKANWENFRKNNSLLKGKTPSEIEQIYGTLSIFSQIFADAEGKLGNNKILMQKKVGEYVKTYAIGTVIDNVREAFSVIIDKKNTKEKDGSFQGLQIDSVQKIGDKIVIAGSFNNSDVKVRYDLKTGKLFMNSLIHKDEVNPNKISIGDTSSISNPDSIDFPIGEIKPFNDVLNDYYKLPPRNSKNNINNKLIYERNSLKPNGEGEKDKEDEKTQIPAGIPIKPNISRNDDVKKKEQDVENILHSQINLISSVVKENTEAQAQKNSTIINFMTTFNIIPEKKFFNSLDFYKSSNLFEVIQIFDNSNSLDLEYFNNVFMPEMGGKYLGLKWGENNIMSQSTENEEKVAEILDYNGKDPLIMGLKENIENFNPNQFSTGTGEFNASHQLGFVNLIKQFLLNDSSKLDKDKMIKFIDHINNRTPDTELEELLNSV